MNRVAMQEKDTKPFIKDSNHVKFIKERMEYTDFEMDMEKMYVQHKIFKKISRSTKGLRMLTIAVILLIVLNIIGFILIMLLNPVLLS